MIQGTKKDLTEYAHRLSLAYARVFENNSVYVQDVLYDLDLFCRIKESTFHPDERVHALLEGRREVGLRINTLRMLTPDQAFAYLTKPIHRGEKKS